MGNYTDKRKFLLKDNDEADSKLELKTSKILDDSENTDNRNNSDYTNVLEACILDSLTFKRKKNQRL